MKVVIPDAVFYEATREAGKLNAQPIIAWVKANHAQIELAVTDTYLNFEAARQIRPNAHFANLGEQAMVEVIEEPGRLKGGELAILLGEETAILKRIKVNQSERIVELSTMDFLKLLED